MYNRTVVIFTAALWTLALVSGGKFKPTVEQFLFVLNELYVNSLVATVSLKHSCYNHFKLLEPAREQTFETLC